MKISHTKMEVLADFTENDENYNHKYLHLA